MADPTSLPLPPQVPGVPFLGNAFGLIGDQNPFLLESYRRFGPIYRVRVPGMKFTVMAGVNANGFLTKAAEDTFSTHEAWGGFADEVGVEKFLPALDGEEHQKYRKLFNKGFSRGTFESSWDQARDVIKASATSFKTGQVVSVVPWMRRLLSDVLGILVAGRPPGKDFIHFDRFLRTILFVRVQKRWPPFMTWLPSFKRAKKRILEFGQEIIDQWQSDDHENRKGNLISDVLEACEKDPTLLSPKDQQFMVISPYIAGMDTVANTCSFMLYALMTHPDILDRVMEEVETYFKTSPTQEDMKGMKALRGTTLETLRRYPVAGLVVRTAMKTFEFEGHRVDKGTQVLVATTMTHFMEEYFSEPYTFNIDRYAPPHNERNQPGVWNPFGLGPHTCIGAGLSEPLIMYTIGTLLHFLRFEIKPAGYKLKYGMTPLPGPKGFKIKISENKLT